MDFKRHEKPRIVCYRRRFALSGARPGEHDLRSLVRSRPKVSRLSLFNDYSVTTAYGHREVLVRGYIHEVAIPCAAEEIARHPWSYQHEDFVLNPLHYLALLERKIGALDQAAPLPVMPGLDRQVRPWWRRRGAW